MNAPACQSHDRINVGPEHIAAAAAPEPSGSSSELAVVGALMANHACASKETPGLSVADYTDPACRRLFAEIETAKSKGEPTDANAMHARGLPCDLLEAAVEAAADVGSIGWHSDQIRAASDKRRVSEILARAQRQNASSDFSASFIAQETTAALAQVSHDGSHGREDDAAAVLATHEDPPPMIATEIFGPGDMFQLNAPSKGRKSFAMLQLAVCVAAGRSFLGADIKASPVVFANLEIRPAFFRARLRRMAKALSVEAFACPLRIIHGRGCTPGEVLTDVRRIARKIGAGLIVLDPVYPLSPTGDENSSKDAKELVLTLANLAETSGAAVAYSHHTAKGQAADRAAIDRGAGSGVLARAYDASLSLLPHAEEADAFVAELVLRNFQPRAPFALRWEGGCFRLAEELTPTPETGRSRAAKALAARPGIYDAAVSTYLRKVPEASSNMIAAEVGCNRSTASRTRNRIKSAGGAA